MKKQPQQSPFRQLMSLVWKNANESKSFSWECLNHSMRNTLELAIGSGFPITVDDFKSLGEYHSGYWIGDSDEWVYSMAVFVGNKSAFTAYEQWKGREPIIAADVTTSDHRGYAHGNNANRQSERLHVGCSFRFQGHKCFVTSFNKDGAVVACSYKDVDRRKIGRRFTITRDDILADRAEQKERTTLEKELTAAAGKDTEKASQILSELGVKTKAEFAALPIARVRKVHKKFVGKAA